MGNLFSGCEIVELGVQIEMNGRDFYNALLRESKSDKAKEIFKFLAGEESKHIVTFQKISERLKKCEEAVALSDEYSNYMHALASEYVFTQKNKGEGIAKNIKSEPEAADLGIKFEKESIVFYQSMKKVVPESEHEVIEELIAREGDHLRLLLDWKRSLSTPG